MSNRASCCGAPVRPARLRTVVLHAAGSTRLVLIMWWSTVAVTTVGYGDFFPDTVSGRVIAVALTIAGIALLGVITATLANQGAGLGAGSRECRFTRPARRARLRDFMIDGTAERCSDLSEYRPTLNRTE